MEQNYEIDGIQMIYHVPLELDHHSARQISDQIDWQIDSGHVRKVIFDFSNTDFMDSSGVGCLIGRHRRLMRFNGEVCVSGVSERIDKLFCALGLYKIVKKMEEKNAN